MIQTDARASKAAMAVIFFTLVLDMLALGICGPVVPQLIQQFVDGDVARAALVFGMFMTIWAVLQFLFSPLLGALSDRFGRRPILLVSCLGIGLNYVVLAAAPTLGWLFVGQIISGISGANVAAASAYVSDVTPPERRAAGFGLLGAAYGIGLAVGPAIGGVLGAIDIRLPFWSAAALSFLNAVSVLFMLTESLPADRRMRFAWKQANPVGSLALLRSQPRLIGFGGAYLIVFLAGLVGPSIAVLYTTFRYGWSQTTIGLTLTAIGVCLFIVHGGLVRLAVAHFGERRTLIAGLLFGAAGYTLYATASSGLFFWLAIPVAALVGLSTPTLLSLMSQRVLPSEQGRLQGANASLVGIAWLIGPSLFTVAFWLSIRPGLGVDLPGTPYILAAVLLLSAAAATWYVTRPQVEPGSSHAAKATTF